jgi:hypothetical protein
MVMAVDTTVLKEAQNEVSADIQYLYYLREGRNTLEGKSFEEQKKTVSLLLKKCIQSKNLNVLTGSGCSLPAISLMGKTFKSLKEKNKSLILGSFDSESEDIEGYLNWLNTGIRFINQNVNLSAEDILYKEQLELSFDITKKFLINSIVKDYGSTNKDVLITKNYYQSFYNALFSIRDIKNYAPVNIYTTNYDLFNEIAMEALSIHYTNGFRGSVNRVFDPAVFQMRLVDDANRYKEKWSIVRKYVKLYKIHGSIDWRYDDNLKNVVQSSLYGNAEDVLIYPTINKHLETQQTPYSELFRELTINLQKPDSTLIILGYGFPDEHINHLISQSLSNEDFNLIVFGSHSEKNAKAFIELHNEKSNFHFIGGSINSSNDGHYFSNVISYIHGGISHEE